ncbi:MAG: single-stranded DNA-binding protein, partial [Candidatus Coproplasma sp.]
MNKVFLIGNLTRDPELTETSGGVSVCRIAIAVNRNYLGSDGERKTD